MSSRSDTFLATEHLQVSIILNRIHSSFRLSPTKAHTPSVLSQWLAPQIPPMILNSKEFQPGFHSYQPLENIYVKITNVLRTAIAKWFLLPSSDLTSQQYSTWLNQPFFASWNIFLSWLLWGHIFFILLRLLLAFHLPALLFHWPLKCWCSSGIYVGPSFFCLYNTSLGNLIHSPNIKFHIHVDKLPISLSNPNILLSSNFLHITAYRTRPLNYLISQT